MNFLTGFNPRLTKKNAAYCSPVLHYQSVFCFALGSVPKGSAQDLLGIAVPVAALPFVDDVQTVPRGGGR